MLLNNLFSNGLGGGSVNERVFDFTATEGQTEFPIPHGGYSVNVSVNGVTLHGPDLNLNDLTKVILLTPRIAGDVIRITLLGGTATGGGIEVGQLVSGFFSGNPKYVPANGSRYLLAAYPDMAQVLDAGGLPKFYEPYQNLIQKFTGSLGTTAFRETLTFVDDDVIMVPQQATQGAPRGSLLTVSVDGGLNWRESLPRSSFVNAVLPQAVLLGLIPSTALCVLSVCKMDQPGHYAALVGEGTSTGNIFFTATTDYGLTWPRWDICLTANTVTIPARIQLFYRNGVFLAIGGSVGRYSTNGGQAWTNLSDSTWVATSGNAEYGSLSPDGQFTLADGTTSVKYFNWPETANAWASTFAFTVATTRFAVGMQYVRKCGNLWVAWSSNSPVVNVAESMLGPYTPTSLSGINGIYDVLHKDGYFYYSVISSASGPYYAVSEATLAPGATFAQLPQTLIPPTTNISTGLRFPLPWKRFAVSIGQTDTVICRFGREDIAKIVAPSGANNLVNISEVIPTSQFPAFCKKYGFWFCSMPRHAQAPTANPNSAVNLIQQTIHYRSVDGKNWVPIGAGVSDIVDAGSRLLRLDGTGFLEQSTDGITWNTSGITRPPYASTRNACRLWRMADVVYLFYSTSATNTATNLLTASLDGGATWTTVTGLASNGAFAKIKNACCKFNGRYLAAIIYVSATPNSLTENSIDSVTVYSSLNGISFTQVFNTNNGGTYSYARALTFAVENVLYCTNGAISGSNFTQSLASLDGFSFVNGTTFPLMVTLGQSQVWDITQNSFDVLFSLDRTFVQGATTLRALDLYKNGSLQFTILMPQDSNQYLSQFFMAEDGECLATNAFGTLFFNEASSTAFMVPIPNAGVSPMPFPFLKVAN